MNLLNYLAPPSATSFTSTAGYCTCSCAIGSRTSQLTWFTSANSNLLVLDHKTDSIAIKSNQAQSKWKFGAYLLFICTVFKFAYWFSSLLSSCVLQESCLLLAFVTTSHGLNLLVFFMKGRETIYQVAAILCIRPCWGYSLKACVYCLSGTMVFYPRL